MFLISYQTGQWQNSQNLQLQLDDSDSEQSTGKLRNLNSPNLSTISSQRNQKMKDFKVLKSTGKTTICKSWQSCFRLQQGG